MRKKQEKPMVREPIQVYLTTDERKELDRLAGEEGISRAEVLRRGIRSYALEAAAGESPVFNLISDLKGSDWPADLGSKHDEHLARAHEQTDAAE